MSKKKSEESAPQLDVLIQRLIELTEKNMIVNLYLMSANRDQIKAVVGVGTDKVDKIISKIKTLKKENKNDEKQIN